MRLIRRQLSLFVAEPEAARLEELRALLDPVQHALIPAHATLAREDELALVFDEDLHERLQSVPFRELLLRFEVPESFHGHGILMRASDGSADFEQLRRRVLGGRPRAFVPHLTLAHPRNPQAPGNALATALASLPVPIELRFDTLNLIEQRDGGPWRVLAQRRS
jgi:2'-5' RNA ligase